jgi:hypothetical protein
MRIQDDSMPLGKVLMDPLSSRGNRVDDSASSTSASVDPELGDVNSNNGQSNQQDLDDDYPSKPIAHKTAFSRRKCRAIFLCGTLLITLFVLAEISFSSKQPVATTTCDLGKSAPYAKNRTVETTMCVEHSEPGFRNPELTDFLLPVENAGKSPLRFLVFGDFGRDGFCCQRDVAVEMERAANAISANFVINTGDSFYDGGIMAATDDQVKTSFLNIYNQPKLKSMNFYSVLGNHEYRGSASAVLQVPGKHPRFTMDGRWYAQAIKASDGSFIQLVFIDTTPMIPSYRIPGYDSPTDNILKREDGISSQWSKVEEQIQWLEGRLQNQRYEFSMRVVIGHHPIYDQSAHVGENRTFLQERVAPLLEKYNVTAYFSGHDHSLQFIKTKETAHFVSGAGSKVAPGVPTADTPESSVQFYYMEHGFMACTVYDNQLRVAVVDMEGNVLDTAVVKARKDV